MAENTSVAARLLGIKRPKRTLIDQWRESCADDMARNLFDEYCRDFVTLKAEGKITFGVDVLLHAIEQDERFEFIPIKSGAMLVHLNRIRDEMSD